MKIEIKTPDKNDLLVLYKKFDEKSFEDFKNNLIKKKEKLMVLKVDNKTSGVIKYKNNKDFSRIESFFLLQKSLRGRGVAQKLYSSYEKKLKGKKFVELYVYQTNKRAIRFWKKLGFKTIKDSKDNKGEKMHYMKKNLRA